MTLLTIQITQIATRMLQYNKARFVVTVVGIAVAFFLVISQFGLLVGWINTNSAIVRHAGVDVWVMAQQTPAFDYGTAIPRNRLYQVRSIPGVAWSEAMFMAWNIWQRGDGRRVNVELVGLDESSVGGPWRMWKGTVNVVHLPDTVIVDELYMKLLGVTRIGESFEMIGERAIVGGISQGVRTFAASPWIFTSIESAISYDKRYRDDEITYVLVRCELDVSPAIVRDRIAAQIPDVEVLTTQEFVLRTVKYWMLETGAGITVVITAVLGLLVGTVIMSQTLFAITQEHLSNYATLLALGFSRGKLVTIVLLQSFTVGVWGISVGSLLFYPASLGTAKTPIPLETTPLIFAGLVVVSLFSCLLASFVSMQTILKIDPVLVFQR